LVYRAGAVLGYVTCHLDPGRVGRIGLFAVAAKAQGRGIGQRLLRASLSWFSERDRTAVRVATQQQNQAALHSYERAGFHVSSVEYWYHRWSTDVPREAMA
jgi:ribosomal protein S18 acetylase RimI-like enzyme